MHDSLADCHKILDPKVLPKEYGGTIPMADMIGELNSKNFNSLLLKCWQKLF